ncbi:MAG: hypothetical protein IH820_13440 [Bacteroidetes bacterium]|nr:hypothetical protein [Bacteroidota bacterium]
MYTPKIIRTLSDSAVSSWLKTALEALMLRDPVDAANDTEYLAKLMRDRADDAARLAEQQEDLAP